MFPVTRTACALGMPFTYNHWLDPTELREEDSEPISQIGHPEAPRWYRQTVLLQDGGQTLSQAAIF